MAVRECSSLIEIAESRFAYFDEALTRWRGLNVLDVGCGEGCISELLARRGCNVWGVDRSAEAVKTAAECAVENGLAIDYRVGSAEKLPYEDATFEVVVCIDVLEHVTDVPKVVREMARVLMPGGFFLFDSINRT